jgi:hypothetical protein
LAASVPAGTKIAPLMCSCLNAGSFRVSMITTSFFSHSCAVLRP